MRPSPILAVLLLAALGACAAGPVARAASDPRDDQETPMIRYLVTLADARAHRVHVRMTIPDAPADGLALALPVWTPGSYLVREFARHVLDLAATDARGAVLPAAKVDKNTWRVETGGAGTVHVEYELYCNERSVRTNHADDGHAFLEPAATFLFVRGRQDVPHRVAIEAPVGWRTFTGLAPDGEAWLAPDYGTLVDSPFEIGPHRELRFEHEGVPFRIVLAGPGALDEQQLVQDVARVVAEVATIFGHIPFDDYTFLVPLVDSGGGGLEHGNSSVCMTSRWKLSDKKGYRRFLSLIAHEFFHAWNVKRFRPEALGPFDWDRENYTGDLWVAEGITSYLDDLSVVRAGFLEKPGEYLDERAKAFRELAELPGARRMSLTHASRDAWIKLYRPDENSRNAGVSYYSKGALVALLLDLRIRRCSEGRATLADALRLGWERYTARGLGYPEGAIATLASEVAGTDLSAFFADWVDGTEPLTPDPDLAWVGLRLAIVPKKTERDLARDEDGFPLEPLLGIATRDDGGLCRVTTVLEDGPAFAAGLNADDVLLAVDAMRVTHGTLQDRLDRTRGEPIELSFWRGESLRRLGLRPELRRVADWKLVPVDTPDATQRAAFEAWCGLELPEPKGDGGQDCDANGADEADEADTRADGTPSGATPAAGG